MTAWVVSKHYIDVLVSAAINHEIPVKLDDLAVPVTATEEIAQQIGAMLWAQNVRSMRRNTSSDLYWLLDLLKGSMRAAQQPDHVLRTGDRYHLDRLVARCRSALKTG